MQTLWNVHPICSGSNVEEGNLKLTLSCLYFFFDFIKSSILPPPIGYLLGGHVIRLFHGHDEVVAIPGSDQSEEEQRWETQNTNIKKKHTDYQGLHTSPDLKRDHPATLMNEKPLRLSLGGGLKMPALLCFVVGGAANTDKSPTQSWGNKSRRGPFCQFPADVSMCVCGSGGTHTHTAAIFTTG